MHRDIGEQEREVEMMVQLPLKFPTEFYIAYATSNMNNYYAPLPRSSTDHQSISRPFNFQVLSSSPAPRNNNSNGKKPWFRPHCIFPRILLHKVRKSESTGPSSSSSSKYRLTACFYKKNVPCRGSGSGSGSAPYMKPADIPVSVSEAKSESFESTDSSLGELQPILTNVSKTKTSEDDGSDHEPRWDYPSEDDMLDDIDRKMAGISMEESKIHINNGEGEGEGEGQGVQDMDTEEANIAGKYEIKLVNAEFVQDATGLPVIDMMIKGEMDSSTDGEFDLDIFKPCIIGTSNNINMDMEESKSSSRISNEEYFELDFSSPTILEEENIIEKDDYKSNLVLDQMKEYRLNSIKKRIEVSSALGHSRRLFVAKKLKDSAKRSLLVLFKPRKHKAKKKIILLTTSITDHDGSDTFWSKPILRGKRCRELPVDEYLYSNSIAGACGGVGGGDDGVLV